jgi:hypothetical protein
MLMKGVEYVVDDKGKKKAVQRTYGGFESVITVLWGSNGRSGFHFRLACPFPSPVSPAGPAALSLRTLSPTAHTGDAATVTMRAIETIIANNFFIIPPVLVNGVRLEKATIEEST